MHILVTGFGPFLDNADNPSQHLARALDGLTLGNHTFATLAPLPVTWAEAASIVTSHADALNTDALLLLGLAASTPYIRIETTGRNRSTTHHPDARGNSQINQVLIPDAPPWISTRVDVHRVLDALIEQGIHGALSHDAGGYVCNDLYFRTLSHERRNTQRPSLFIHVPAEAHTRKGLAVALGRAFLAGLNDHG